jgi:hypothetical protein
MRRLMVSRRNFARARALVPKLVMRFLRSLLKELGASQK